jgi:hypothetical protein
VCAHAGLPGGQVRCAGVRHAAHQTHGVVGDHLVVDHVLADPLHAHQHVHAQGPAQTGDLAYSAGCGGLVPDQGGQLVDHDHGAGIAAQVAGDVGQVGSGAGG